MTDQEKDFSVKHLSDYTSEEINVLRDAVAVRIFQIKCMRIPSPLVNANKYQKRANEMLPKFEKWEEILKDAAKEAHERETHEQ